MTLSKIFSMSLVAVAAVAATSAFAQREPNLPVGKPVNTTPLKSADVKAETLRAEKTGELDQNMNRNPGENAPSVGTPKTRAEVKADTAAARAANGGELKTPKD